MPVDLEACCAELQTYLNTSVERLLNNVEVEIVPEKGMSILSAKYGVLMNYCADLCDYMKAKLLATTRDEESNSEPLCIDRLIEGRIILEKLRPIEAKLKIQIERLLHTPTGQAKTTEENPLLYKAMPKNFASLKETTVNGKKRKDFERTGFTSDDEKAGDDQAEVGGGLYRPPKVAPMYFDDKTKKGRGQREEEHKKKKMATSAMVRQLREEYSEKPMEIDERTMAHVADSFEKHQDVEGLEFGVREPEKKGKKKADKKPRFRTMADELEDLFDVHYSQGEEDDRELRRLQRNLKVAVASKKTNGKKGAKRVSDSEEIYSSEDF